MRVQRAPDRTGGLALLRGSGGPGLI
jgi:hypothetical protein